MALDYKNGYMIFDKSWIHDNAFMQSLSHPEFRVMIYLICSVLRISKGDRRFKNGELIATHYRQNGILFVNASQETIAEKCGMERSTAYRAVHKFRDWGAIVKVSDAPQTGSNDIHIVGFEQKEFQDVGKWEYYLVDSLALKSGEKLPDRFKTWLMENYQRPVFNTDDPIWKAVFGIKQGRPLAGPERAVE